MDIMAAVGMNDKDLRLQHYAGLATITTKHGLYTTDSFHY